MLTFLTSGQVVNAACDIDTIGTIFVPAADQSAQLPGSWRNGSGRNARAGALQMTKEFARTGKVQPHFALTLLNYSPRQRCGDSRLSRQGIGATRNSLSQALFCLLYTSDAADE